MIIVTVEREPFKRYVVDEDDEYLFDTPPEQYGMGFFIFGAQAIRKNGIDESYRSLSSDCVLKVTRK